MQWDMVFLPGFSADFYPMKKPGFPVFSEKERRGLSDHLSSGNLDNREYFQAEEQLLFHLAISSARKYIIFSYPYADEKGREKLPSSFVYEVSRLLGIEMDLEQFQERIPLGQQIVSSEKIPGYTILEEISPAVLNIKGLNSVLSEISPDLINRTRLARVEKRIEIEQMRDAFIHRDHGTEWEGVLNPDLVRKTFADPVFSPSQFEEYAQCRFLYLAKRIWGIEPLEKPEEELTPLRRGSIYHRILQIFHERVKAQNLDFCDEHMPMIILLLHESMKKVFQKEEQKGGLPLELLWEVEKEQIRQVMRSYVEYYPDRFNIEKNLGIRWIPTFFEEQLQNEEGEKIVDFPLVQSIIKIRGKIDRVDISKDHKYFRIIDYKTGATVKGKREIQKGLAFQIFIYLLSFQDLIRRYLEKDVEIFGGSYILLRKMELKSGISRFSSRAKEIREDKDWASLIKKGKSYLEKYIQLMKEGNFWLMPKDCLGKRCDYYTLCRITPLRREAGKALME
jgi:ATP-dependent helicase/DNAse subunit B